MEFDRAIAELDTLVGTLERDGDERALMLLELIDAIHRPALELIAAGELDHPVAQAVLQMYGLAPVDDHLQVEDALDEIRPYVESHGGNVELLSVEDGIVHIRMSGACHGCAGSAITLRRGIESSLRELYPGFKGVVAHDPEGAAGNGAPQLLQIEVIKRPVFKDVGPLDELAPGQVRAVDVGGTSVLILGVEGEPYAFRNMCPVEADREVSLEGGRLTGTVLVCPWHNCAYDARSGERVDDQPDLPALVPVPIAVKDGRLSVAVDVA